MMGVYWNSVQIASHIALKDDRFSHTFTITEAMVSIDGWYYVEIRIGGKSGVFSEFQIELGSTATAYTPYVSGGQDIMVKTFGKNIVNVDEGLNACLTKNGDVYTMTKLNSNRFSADIPCRIPAGQNFTLSAEKLEYTGTYRYWLQVAFYDESGTNFATAAIESGQSSTTRNVPRTISRFRIYSEISDANGTYFSFKNFQVEISNTATAYEPYKEGPPTITSTQDEANFQSIAPNMTLTTDTDGAVIEANYEKDSNIVIDKLTKAVIALGGNV